MSEINYSQLSKAASGAELVIKKIQSSPETNLRLRELGLLESSCIRLVSNGSAQIICEVNNTRIGLHHRVAKDILVSSKTL